MSEDALFNSQDPMLVPGMRPVHEVAQGLLNSQVYERQFMEPESFTLTKGDETVFDAYANTIAPTEIGLPNEYPESKEEVSIVGNVQLSGVAGDSLSIVRLHSGEGVDRWFIVGKEYNDEAGNVQRSWVQLDIDSPLIVGRRDGNNQHKHIVDGMTLNGKEFSHNTSRQHAVVSLAKNGLTIKDISSNGTSVQGVLAEIHEKKSTILTPEAGANIASMQEVAVVGKDKVYNESIEAQLKKLDDDIALLKDGVSDKQSLDMWKYASNMNLKRDAQQKDDGNGSYFHEAEAGKAYNALTPDLKLKAEIFRDLMQRKSVILNKLR